LDNEGGKGIIIRSKNKPGNKQTKVIALNHVNHNNRKKKGK
jgi:co-chaperonin GroES (HSP10)